MEIKDYTIIASNSGMGLATEVNIKIKDGWQPIGGVAVITGMPVNSQGGAVQPTVLIQAMGKK